MKSPVIRRSYRCFLATALAALLLAGCGQYGDLYLPEKAPVEETRAPATTPSPTEDEDQQEVTQPEPL